MENGNHAPAAGAADAPAIVPLKKSASFMDVRSVDGGVPAPPLKRSKLNTLTVNLLDGKKAVQVCCHATADLT